MNLDYKNFFKSLYQKINDDDILGNAAQVAFYFSFALFPLLLFLMSLFGLILNNKTELQTELFSYLQTVMPTSAFELVKTTLLEVTKESSGGKLTIGILITIWAASAGIDNLRGALNGVYNLKENRSWLKSKLIAVLLTLVFGAMILVTLSFIFYGTQILALILPFESPFILKPLEWLTILLALLFMFAMLYNFLPNHSPVKLKFISPGAISAIILWLICSGGFQLYLHYFNSYAKTYGSLGAMIILLLWLYLTALVILIGGAVNAILDKNAGIEKENADPQQELEEQSDSGKESKN